MPKAPILDRETYFVRLRDGSCIDFDWNLVNTSLGAMVEPRQALVGGSAAVDPYDASYSRRVEINPDQFFATHGTGGTLVPFDYQAQ